MIRIPAAHDAYAAFIETTFAEREEALTDSKPGPDLSLACDAGFFGRGGAETVLFQDTVTGCHGHGRADELSGAFSARGSPRGRGAHFF
jgi:hypothetical protein